MKIDFQFDTQYGKFSDALHLPDDHGLTQEEINSMQQQRLDNWIAIVTAPPDENVSINIIPPTPIGVGAPAE